MTLSSTDCVVIAAFKAMTTGRLALAYYSETPANDFVNKLEKWKESFTREERTDLNRVQNLH